jgi:hypothetical protein
VSSREDRDVASLPTATLVGDAKLIQLASRLRALHEGDVAVVEAIAIGAPAIPVLRMILFERDFAGIFEPRRRAVQALAVLKATNVLKEFVGGWKPASDPSSVSETKRCSALLPRLLARPWTTKPTPCL